MFKEKYTTKGVALRVPDYLRYFMFGLIENMKTEKDYLQVFSLEKASKGSCILQKIIHEQEKPEYRREYVIPVVDDAEAVECKILVIDDEPYCTMLLEEEY